MSLIDLGARRPQHARQLPAVQAAEIAVEQAVMDSQLTRKDCLADESELGTEAEQARSRSAAALGRQFHTGRVTSAVTFAAVLGCVMIFAGGALEYLLFHSMGIPPAFALLLACVSLGVYGGVGTVALILLKGSRSDQAYGVALLVGLAALAVFLVPQLAQARANEMFAEDLAEAQSVVEVTTELGGAELSRGEALQLREAQHAQVRLTEKEETARRVFVFVLAMTLIGELVLSGYSADMISRARADRLAKKADRLEAAARDARRDADAQDLEIYQALADIAAEHVLSIDTVDRLTEGRIAAHTRAVPPTEAHDPHPAPAEVIDLTQRIPGAGASQPTPTTPQHPPGSTDQTADPDRGPLGAPVPRPRGSVTTVDVPPDPQQSIPLPDQWDGVWA